MQRASKIEGDVEDASVFNGFSLVSRLPVKPDVNRTLIADLHCFNVRCHSLQTQVTLFSVYSLFPELDRTH